MRKNTLRNQMRNWFHANITNIWNMRYNIIHKGFFFNISIPSGVAKIEEEKLIAILIINLIFHFFISPFRLFPLSIIRDFLFEFSNNVFWQVQKQRSHNRRLILLKIDFQPCLAGELTESAKKTIWIISNQRVWIIIIKVWMAIYYLSIKEICSVSGELPLLIK